MTAIEWKYVYDACIKYGISLPLLDAGGFKDWHYCAMADYDGGVTGLQGTIRTKDLGPWSKIVKEWDVTHELEKHQGEYGMIISTSTLEHTKTPYEFINSAYNLLKEGGLMILTAPFIWPEHGTAGYDFWRFTPSGLALISKQFNVLEKRYLDYPSERKMSAIVLSKGELVSNPFSSPNHEFYAVS